MIPGAWCSDRPGTALIKARREFLDRLARLPARARENALGMATTLHHENGLSWYQAARLAGDRAEMWARHEGLLPAA